MLQLYWHFQQLSEMVWLIIFSEPWDGKHDTCLHSRFGNGNSLGVLLRFLKRTRFKATSWIIDDRTRISLTYSYLFFGPMRWIFIRCFLVKKHCRHCHKFILCLFLKENHQWYFKFYDKRLVMSFIG